MRSWFVIFGRWPCILLLLVLLAGCTAPVPAATPGASATPPATALPAPSLAPATSIPTLTTTVTPLPAATFTSTPAPSGMCSPLQGIQLGQMKEILQGAMQTPHPGQDDGHHGDDYAFYRFNGLEIMEGLPVQSVLAGTVVSVVNDRKPYGNMVIIETPLENIPPNWLASVFVPTPSAAMPADGRMVNCPADPAVMPGTGPGRSLYLLYAHLREPSPLKTGEVVACGQSIGAVGNTGMSGNPHLHLEVRVGPSGARFGSMAYYDASATAEEYATYCTWRVSQLFQLMNPLEFLSLQP
jgi:murein DD-endopeptidase MepM/ murein hydrolase activator NlpD